MNKKSRLLSIGIAGTLLMSFGSGAAMAVESAPGAFDTAPTTVVTNPANPVTSISESQAKELREKLEAKIKSEYAYWFTQKEKSESETRSKNATFAEQRKVVEAAFAKETYSINQRKITLEAQLKEKNSAFEKAKTEAYTKLESLRSEAETKAKKLEERFIAAQKAYEVEKRSAKTDASRRAAEVKFSTTKTQIQTEKATLLANLERDRNAVVVKLNAAVKDHDQAVRNYQNGVKEANTALVTLSNKKIADLRLISENQSAFGKAKSVESEILNKKLAEAKVRWEKERAELEAKIKAGTASTVK